MANKNTRFIDDQGRVILPAHIRKALNLSPGNVVEVALEDDDTIRIRPSTERCCICGNSIETNQFIKLTEGKDRKLICSECAQNVANALFK